LANYEAEKPRFLPIGLSGVWNWRGIITREPGPDGKLHAVKGIIDDFNLIEWKDRKVIILFDSDAQQNPKIRLARRRLANELEGRV
jgi:hypothetical protein